jgi:hypothetical protein
LFDQGLRLLYAFDDREALRTFLEAAHLKTDGLSSGFGKASTHRAIAIRRRSMFAGGSRTPGSMRMSN